MSGRETGDAMVADLHTLAEALEKGDTAAAAVAAGRLTAACDEARAQGVRLEVGPRGEMERLFQRCGVAASKRGEAIRALLLQTGNSRRAIASYRAR